MKKKFIISAVLLLLFVTTVSLTACKKDYNPEYDILGKYGGSSAGGYRGYTNILILHETVLHTKLFNYTQQEEIDGEEIEYTVMYGYWEIIQIYNTPYSGNNTAKTWKLKLTIIYDNSQTNPNAQYEKETEITIEDNTHSPKVEDWYYRCIFNGHGMVKPK